MTDRELLELAAKAAGLQAQWDCPARGMMMLTPDGIDTMSWNPLEDDAHALQLAVRLGIDVGQLTLSRCAEAWRRGIAIITEDYGSDPYAATRRAIVRAAAEIGRNMK